MDTTAGPIPWERSQLTNVTRPIVGPPLSWNELTERMASRSQRQPQVTFHVRMDDVRAGTGRVDGIHLVSLARRSPAQVRSGLMSRALAGSMSDLCLFRFWPPRSHRSIAWGRKSRGLETVCDVLELEKRGFPRELGAIRSARLQCPVGLHGGDARLQRP